LRVVSSESIRIGFVEAVERLSLCACALAAFLLLSWVLVRCGTGFDFTDEGFYLNWISSPSDYSASVSEFGFVYHPLYELVGGDLAQFRQANVVILFGSAFLLSLAVFRICCAEDHSVHSAPLLAPMALAFITAACSTSFFDLWLPTPSYNSLTYLSLLIAATGFVLIMREQVWLNAMSWILIGLGGALTFLGKPTSAAGLACVFVMFLLFAGRLSISNVFVPFLVAAVTLLIAALMIDGSPLAFFHRLQEGARLASLLVHDKLVLRIFRLDRFTFSHEQRIIFVGLWGLASLAAMLGALDGRVARLGAAILSLALAATVAAVTTGIIAPNIAYARFQPMQYMAICIAMIASTVISQRRPARSRFAIAALCFVLPYIYAFGTENNYWEQEAHVGLFWLLGAFAISLDFERSWRRSVPAVATAMIVPVVALSAAMEHPYRQPEPLRLQTAAVSVGPQHSKIRLDSETEAYVRDLRNSAEGNGFLPGGPVIDLSGHPGTVYAIGGRALGAPWLLPGYEGSEAYLRSVFDAVDCRKILASWLLVETGTSYSFAQDILARYRIKAPDDYKEVGHARSAALPEVEYTLLKPTRTVAEASTECEHDKPQVQRGAPG
jgi:hypothetical protein